MLLEVFYENFRSMKKATKFDLSAESICEFRDSIMRWNRNKTDEYRIVPLKILYGQNASGKSNLLLGIKILQEIISAGRVDVPLSVPYEQLVYYKGKRKPIKLGVTLIHENRVIEYHLSFDKERIHSESLSVNCFMLFQRKGNQLELAKTSKAIENFDEPRISSLELNEKQFDKYCESDIFLTRGFKNFIAPTLARLIQDFFEKFLLVSLNSPADFSPAFDLQNKQEVLDCLTSLRVDDSLDGVRPLSQGMLRFIHFVDLFYTKIKEGGVLILDELDVSIDPNLLIPLLSKLHDPKINCNKTQVIFTTFNSVYLNKYFIRRDEVTFVSKKEDATVLKSLIDYANRENNYMRKYLSGEYDTIAVIDYHSLVQR